jgi:acyl-CoA synthetase (AMP-forming)/AMP-acid ligase II
MTDSGYKPILEGRFNTLGEALGAAAEQFGNHAAFRERGNGLSYREWLRAADTLSARWTAQGIGAGDVIAILLNSSIEYAIAYAAAVRLGAVASGINTRLGPRELSAILAHCAPRLAILEADVSLAHGIDIPLMRKADVTACVGNPPSRFAPHRAERHDPAVIVWTSGTTGQPKGAWFDHAALEAAVSTAGVAAAPRDRRLIPTPFCHAGYATKVWENIAFATTIVISPPPWGAAEMLELLISERVTVGAAAPTQWAKLLELPQLAQADVSELRLCMTSSAPADPELIEAITVRLAPLITRYAMTEAHSVSGTMPHDAPETLYRTVGKPAPGVDVELVDQHGAPVARGQVGRIRVRAPTVMRGYWRAAARTAQVLSDDGWLTTGDLGSFRPDGNLVLAGRVDDMYIRGGYNVYPPEVEDVLREHPDVQQAAVVGLKTQVIGEIGVAFIVPEDRSCPPSADDLRQWCRERLADYKAPDRVMFLDALPVTLMMKIDKRRLRQMAAHE